LIERFMRFLDLDLDFFLNDNAYRSESDSGRLGAEYKPWSVSRVRHFLEERCSLSHDTPIPGRTIESHDEVLDFWRTLIESGGLRVPFEVIHIDAHPDLSVRGGLYLTSGLLYIDSERGLAILRGEHVYSGNYLTFAIAYGWLASLVWVPLRKTLKDLPKRYGDAGHALMQPKNRKNGRLPVRCLSAVEWRSGVPFRILSWYKFRTSETFDYMALSRSPNFTPPESDALVPVVEGYMRQI
jgi:hypothetical protein